MAAKIGRPTDMTEAVVNKITLAIRNGNYASVAARYAGISETTFYRWMAQGREASQVYDPDATESVDMTQEDFGKLSPEEQSFVIADTLQVWNNDRSPGQTTVTFQRRVDPDKSFREFWEAIKDAEAEAEVEAVAFMRKGMEGHWQAAATYLERRHPDRWRRRETVYNEEPPAESISDRLLTNPKARELAAQLEEELAAEEIEKQTADQEDE